jgi:peptidoglycan/LPS O-acetylase OafA/YrhL
MRRPRPKVRNSRKAWTASMTRRLNYLDSIRGLAACLVLLHHCWISSTDQLDAGFSHALSSYATLSHYIIDKLLAGRVAVIIFFVLSGFVLTISLQKRPLSYVSFACKRFCRIYPAFAAAITLSYVLHYWIGAPHNFQNLVSGCDE